MNWLYAYLGGIALTILSVKFLLFGHFYLYYSVYVALLFSHYLFSVTYSSRSRALFDSKNGWALLVCAVAIASAVYLINPEINFFLFGLHFAFSEVYSKKSYQKDEDRVLSNFNGTLFSTTHILIYFVGYLYAFRNTLYFAENLRFLLPYLTDAFLLFSLIALCIGYVFQFIFLHSKIFSGEPNLNRILQFFLIEILLLSLIPVCRKYELHYVSAIFYHLFFWVLSPIFTNSRLATNKLRYFGWTFLAAVPFFALSPYVLNYSSLRPENYLVSGEVGRPSWLPMVMDTRMQLHLLNWYNAGMWFGILHILLSIYTSPLNPRWITGRIQKWKLQIRTQPLES